MCTTLVATPIGWFPPKLDRITCTMTNGRKAIGKIRKASELALALNSSSRTLLALNPGCEALVNAACKACTLQPGPFTTTRALSK